MFSALIPVYNHENYIYEAILSCLADDLVEEVILVDDGSSDSSPEIIQSFAMNTKVTILDNGGVNLGAHNRINQLVRAAKSQWLAVLNSDDAFIPHRFQLAKQIIREQRPTLITGGITIVDETSRVIGLKRGPADPEFPFPVELTGGDQRSHLARLLNQNYVATTSNMIFSRGLFEALGGFRDYRYIHDWDFAIRAYITSKCVLCPASLTKYRVHSANTIKENPLFTDGEVTRMFARIFAEFSRSLHGADFASAIRGNLHIDESARQHIAHGMEKHLESDRRFEKIYIPSVKFTPYERRSLLAQQIATAASSKQQPPIVHSSNIPRYIIHRDVIHVPRLTDETERLGRQDLGATSFSDQRPTVFILSGFFAVGGVERNTVEIIRNLSSEFRFVAVTFEPHFEEVGSLHHQLDDLGVICVDLGHLVPENQFAEVLARLNALFEPQAVWLINGASWLAANAGRVRSIFAEARIIDQQVYDTSAGWINEFHRPGVLAADEFIAVNKKISRAFRARYNIPAHLIHQIYPALSFDRVSAVDSKRSRRQEVERQFGLATGKFNIGFIGRLTSQKRPERFIRLAKNFVDKVEYQFILIGTGPLEAECKRVILEENVTNIQMINFFEDVSEIGAILDGLIICSDYEGLPIALLECMAMHIPFFSTDVGDIREVSDEYGGGVIVDNWDDSEIVPLVAKWLARNAELRIQLDDHGLMLRQNFAAHALAKDYQRLFG